MSVTSAVSVGSREAWRPNVLVALELVKINGENGRDIWRAGEAEEGTMKGNSGFGKGKGEGG
jgi:hypothetical protein